MTTPQRRKLGGRRVGGGCAQGLGNRVQYSSWSTLLVNVAANTSSCKRIRTRWRIACALLAPGQHVGWEREPGRDPQRRKMGRRLVEGGRQGAVTTLQHKHLVHSTMLKRSYVAMYVDGVGWAGVGEEWAHGVRPPPGGALRQIRPKTGKIAAGCVRHPFPERGGGRKAPAPLWCSM